MNFDNDRMLNLAAYVDHVSAAYKYIKDGIPVKIVIIMLSKYGKFYNNEIKRIINQFLTKLELHYGSEGNITSDDMIKELDDLLDTVRKRMDSVAKRGKRQ